MKDLLNHPACLQNWSQSKHNSTVHISTHHWTSSVPVTPNTCMPVSKKTTVQLWRNAGLYLHCRMTWCMSISMADSRILSHGMMCDMPPNASMHALQAQTQKYQFYSNAWEHHVTFFELVNLTLYHHYAIPCVPKKVSPLTFCSNNRKSAPI